MTVTPLQSEIIRLIAATGPLSIAQYMTLCLVHPQHGYYVTRDPLGAAGDFTTAPEISQVFGELIGLWGVSVWRMMGAPQSFHLVELGPGRGTLMQDALRAARVLPDFLKAAKVHLVEISPVLKRAQEQTLSGAEVPIRWQSALDRVPDGPLIVFANEFLDALPIQQVMRQADGWHERMIDVDAAGNLVFTISPFPIAHFDRILPAGPREAPLGAIYEWRGDNVMFEIGRRVARFGGAALLIDYGHVRSGAGDTLQAVGAHAYADPLSSPGQVDLTAHVDFEQAKHAAESIGARVHGPIEQRTFLRSLGIEARAAALKTVASSDSKAAEIDAAIARLLDDSRTGMGALFKAMAVTDPKLRMVPGFDA